MEMTTAYTSDGPILWAWDWCGGNAGIGKLVTIDEDFLNTYTTTVNGQTAYTTEVRQTDASTTPGRRIVQLPDPGVGPFLHEFRNVDLSDRGYGWVILNLLHA